MKVRMPGSVVTSVAALLCISVVSVNAQIANPADAAAGRAAEKKAPQEQKTDARLRSWEYPVQTIDVTDTRIKPLREEGRIGSYGQPLWTATRRFPTTRVYVIPEGKMEFEYWLRTTIDDDKTKYRSLWEVEFGLPGRLQLDLYLRTDESTDEDVIKTSEQIELRYALADWGKIPGNPTLYFEWIRHTDDPDQIEPKLLLGGELAQGWHWGLNLVGEFQVSGDLEREYRVDSGLSCSLIDYKLSLGVEGRAAYTDTKEDRGNFEKQYYLGPTIQYRPYPPMTINIAPTFGLGADSAKAQIWFNVGWEL